jgi:hypothetical protein
MHTPCFRASRPRLSPGRTLPPARLVAGLFACVMSGLAASATAASAPAAVGDASCRTLADAVVRQITTPTHLYMTEVAAFKGGKERRSETIYAGGAIYVRLDGKWTRSAITLKDLHDQQATNQRDTKGATCRHLRDEALNGEAAAVYSTHSDSDGDQIDSTIWISKSKGLPLRQEIDMNVGGKLGKSHMSTRYEYVNVQPPPM